MTLTIAADPAASRSGVKAWIRHRVLRNVASDAYDHHFGKPWRPQSAWLVNRRTLNATPIDSRGSIAARKRAETQVMLPVVPKFASTGEAYDSDLEAIRAALDGVRGKHTNMILLHGG